jgi:hypothetical protein
MQPNYDIYPGNTAGGAKRWIENRIMPGDFLAAVIRNNLKEALGRADIENRAAIFDIVSWWYNEAPSPCWGSPEKVKAWAKSPGNEEKEVVA